jgi:hypothetical protein
MKSHLSVEVFLARERTAAEAAVAKNRAAEALTLRQDAAGLKFAALHPDFALEVETKLQAMVANAIERTPSWNVAALANIERCKRDAFNLTMRSARIALSKKAKASA